VTITEFLEARIAEDEKRAYYYGSLALGTARVLAECAAKRAIIKQYGEYSECAAEYVGIAALGARCAQQATLDALKALAAVYKDHPDYQQKWAL